MRRSSATGYTPGSSPAIARAIGHLDIGHQLSILDLIARLNRETGMTIIAVFHELNLAAEYCQRLLVLDRGRVAAVGEPTEVLTAETILTVFGAAVRVDRNPLSNKPQVVVTAGRSHGPVLAGPIATNSPQPTCQRGS
ncbi:MAG: ABC transporter ATP-binding protein [Planctomycetota bacterium]|nr:ABC transporter ATP-binding protein [Planctomycetota bacterium]